MKNELAIAAPAQKKKKPVGLAIYSIVIFAFLYLPLVVVVLFSFSSSTASVDFSKMTLDWYTQVFQNEKILSALQNSLFVSCVAVAFAVVVGTAGAVFLNRVRSVSYTHLDVYKRQVGEEVPRIKQPEGDRGLEGLCVQLGIARGRPVPDTAGNRPRPRRKPDGTRAVSYTHLETNKCRMFIF